MRPRRKCEVPMRVIALQPAMDKRTEAVQQGVTEEGKKHLINQRGDELEQALKSGETFLLADLRGTGELEDPEEFNASKYHDSQYRNDQISLHIGKPVIGQRVQDIITILDFIEA